MEKAQNGRKVIIVNGGTSAAFCANMTVLDMSHTNTDESNAVAFAEAIRQLVHLKECNFSSNPIGPVGGIAICNALQGKKTLKRLFLNKSSLGDSGISGICNSLLSMPSLQKLGVMNNDIGEVGAKNLAEVIRNHKTLVWLRLGYNRIGDNGTCYLAAALAYRADFHTFGIGTNNVRDRGILALSKIILNIVGLKELILAANEYSGETQRVFNSYVEHHHCIITCAPFFSEESIPLEMIMDRNQELLVNKDTIKFDSDISKRPGLVIQGLTKRKTLSLFKDCDKKEYQAEFLILCKPKFCKVPSFITSLKKLKSVTIIGGKYDWSICDSIEEGEEGDGIKRRKITNKDNPVDELDSIDEDCDYDDDEDEL